MNERSDRLRELRESKAWFQAIFDSVSDIIAVHDPVTGVFLDVNQRMCDTLGYTCEEILERDVGAISSGKWPYAQEHAMELIRKAAAGEPQIFEWHTKDKWGRLLWIEVGMRGAVLGGETRVLVVGRDITERKRAEEEVRAAESRFRSMVEQSPLGTLIQAPDGHILYFNPAFVKFCWGYYTTHDNLEVLMESYNVLNDKELEAKGLMPYVRAAFAGEAVVLPSVKYDATWTEKEFGLTLGTKKVFWLRLHMYPLKDKDGHVREVVSVLEDVTLENEAQEQQREFYRRTIQAATQGKLEVVERNDIEKIAGPPGMTLGFGTTEELSNARHAVTRSARSIGMDESRASDFTVAVCEAITNAIKHAGGGTVSIHTLPKAILAVVSDQGPGIATLAIPKIALVKGYTTAGTLGMGYKIIIAVADRLYLATGPGGTTVGIKMMIEPLRAF